MASAGLPTLVLGVLFLIVGAASAMESCSSGYELIQNDCFKLVQDKKSVTDAEIYCEFESGTLAAMSTLETKESVVDYVNRIASGQYWTSGADMGSGRFLWANTQGHISPRLRGRQFRPGTCVYLCSLTRMFWDRPCDERLGFICQKKPQLDINSVEAF